MYERYHHDVVGVNSGQYSAVLNAKLPLLDQYTLPDKMQLENIRWLSKENKHIVAPSICDICDCHVFHQYTLRIIDADRDGLMQHLLAKGIPCAIYYPIPLHLKLHGFYNKEEDSVQISW
jgi:dTDP-4-amino-4,6-dideoxygalactose transaminase